MRSCLVVDDSHVVRTVARKSLEQLGIEVTEAATGAAAREACRAARFEAVLLDWDLPDGSGVELMRTLCGAGEATPAVVVCSRDASPERLAEAVREGAAEYLVKPFDGEVLRTRFRLAGLVP